MWRLGVSGRVAQAAVMIARLRSARPAGGGLAWAVRTYRMETGTWPVPGSAISFDRRQWRRQARSARARIAAPGSVPLTYRNGTWSSAARSGGTASGETHRRSPLLPAALAPGRNRHDRHREDDVAAQAWAGSWRRPEPAGGRDGRRPLLVVLDCKGGADSRRIADRARRVLRDAGARATAIWPDDANLSLWICAGTADHHLLDLIEHGHGAAAYYTDVMEAIVALAVHAPPARRPTRRIS